MDKLNAELAKVVSEARKHRGGKPAKYPGLEKYGDSIVKLLDSDVQLPYILKWLVEEKKEDLVLNTLRKYVILKVGRDGYENYLRRNGWMKSKRVVAPAATTRSDEGETKPKAPPIPGTKPPGISDAEWISQQVKLNKGVTK